LNYLKECLENTFYIEISDQSLHESIALHNETRRLQRGLLELNKGAGLKLTGSELNAVMIAGKSMPKAVYNRKLEKLLQIISACDEAEASKTRLLFAGEELDYPGLFDTIESQGGRIVVSFPSFGYCAIENDIDETGDPISAIAYSYLMERISSPRMFGTRDILLSHIDRLVEEYHIEGVVSARLPFCDRWGFFQKGLAEYLKGRSIPCLKLETDYIPSAQGQIMTRVQAFIETINGDFGV